MSDSDSEHTHDVTLNDLIALAQQFNEAAEALIGQDEDLIHAAEASFAKADDTLKAIEAEVPAPGDEVEAANKLLEDAQNIQIKNMLRKMGAAGTVQTPFGTFDLDAPDGPAPDDDALEAAENVLEAYNDKVAPIALKFEETLAAILTSVLPAEDVDSILDGFEEREQFSAAFEKNNAPALAAAFRPRPLEL